MEHLYIWERNDWFYPALIYLLFLFIRLMVPCLWLVVNRVIYPPWFIFYFIPPLMFWSYGYFWCLSTCVILLFLFLFYFLFISFLCDFIFIFILFMFKGGHFLIRWKPNLNFNLFFDLSRSSYSYILRTSSFLLS